MDRGANHSKVTYGFICLSDFTTLAGLLDIDDCLKHTINFALKKTFPKYIPILKYLFFWFFEIIIFSVLKNVFCCPPPCLYLIIFFRDLQTPFGCPSIVILFNYSFPIEFKLISRFYIFANFHFRFWLKMVDRLTLICDDGGGNLPGKPLSVR